MDKVYLETSFIGYLTSGPSRDPIVADHQQTTRQWWRTRRFEFELYVSQRVIDEAGAGDEAAARGRLAVLNELTLLDLSEEVMQLADELVADGPFPKTAVADAVHVAAATIHGIDFLLTWNCRHIANAQIARAAAIICSNKGYEFPRLCTPEQLMGE